jgi:hypothetical protein
MLNEGIFASVDEDCRDEGGGQWRVKDLNLRRQSRGIYRHF